MATEQSNTYMIQLNTEECPCVKLAFVMLLYICTINVKFRISTTNNACKNYPRQLKPSKVFKYMMATL